MELSKLEIYHRINQRSFNIDNLNLIVKDTFERTKMILENYHFNKENELYSGLNPLLWEFGHFLFFWEHLVIKNLYVDVDYQPQLKKELYDSYVISKTNRFKYYSELKNKEELYKIFNNIYNCIKFTKLNKINKYLIYLGCLHQHMHNESFLFSFNKLNYKFNFINYYDYLEPYYEKIEMIYIKGEPYIQGTNKDFYFDNEYPPFKITIDDFQVSKHCICNYQFLQFVKDGGYSNKDYWTLEGWEFILNLNLKYPEHWFKRYNDFYETVFGQNIELRYNLPVRVSFHEAQAFCKWAGYKMLTESQWEYLADNKKNANFDYHYPISVRKELNVNRYGVYGLYGNYWEWCDTDIYPYDGFVIDPVYREMSYPFFGYKKICRGGSWCCPEYLVTRTYRNAQLPDCNYQFISFRVTL